MLEGKKIRQNPWLDPAWLSISLQKHESCNNDK